MPTAARKPKAPAKLQDSGRRLWRDIAGAYQLRPDELRLLEDACREADLIDRLQSVVDGTVRMVTRGSQGQDVADPLISELRQHRAVLKGLLQSLKLPDPEAAAGTAAGASAAGRALVANRWKRGA